MNDDAYYKWLAGLKVGDKVAVHATWPGGERYEIREVVKLLKDRIRVDGYEPFKAGKINSFKDHVTHLELLTDEIQNIIDRKVLLSELSRLDIKRLSTEQLRDIKKIVDV